MQNSKLSEEDYQRLRSDLAQNMQGELRRIRRQNLFTLGLQAIILVIIAIVVFRASRQYHDVSLWAAGLCLLIFSSLDFLDIEYTSTGRSWMDLFLKSEDHELEGVKNEEHTR